MQYAVGLLIAMLANAMKGLVGRALVALGISFVTYKGMTAATGALEQFVRSNFQGIGGDALAFLVWMNVDKALSMVIASYGAVMALKAIGGAVTKMQISKAAP